MLPPINVYGGTVNIAHTAAGDISQSIGAQHDLAEVRRLPEMSTLPERVALYIRTATNGQEQQRQENPRRWHCRSRGTGRLLPFRSA